MLQPKDIDWLNGYKNKTCMYAVYRRPTSNHGTHTESERVEKCIPCKWKSKESWSNNIHIKAGDPLQIRGHILNVRGWKNVFHENGNQRKAGVTIFISDKEHYIMIKGSVQKEDITIVTIYAPNIGAPQYIRQMLTTLKGEINSNTIIVGDFNTLLSSMDQMDLIDIYRASIQKQQNTHSFQVHMEHSPGLITCWATK